MSRIRPKIPSSIVNTEIWTCEGEVRRESGGGGALELRSSLHSFLLYTLDR
jgi:hypothetical protein